MNRKVVGGLLISFFIVFILVIISLFVNFGKISVTIYTVFIGELLYLTWVATRKISIKSPLRRFVGAALILFFPLLILTILSLIFNLGGIEKVIYFLFGLDFLFLFVLFLRRQIRNYLAKKAKIEVEKETLFERITKYVVYLIPVVIFGYVIWMNFNPLDETIVYDIGGPDDKGILYPTERVSDTLKTKNSKLNYRDLRGSLVYFDVPIPPNSKKIGIEIKFKTNFIEEPFVFKLGGKTGQTWEYTYKSLYNTKLNELNIDYNSLNYPRSFEETEVIWSDIPSLDFSNEIFLQDYTPKNLVVETGLRGGHIFFVYVKGNLEMKIHKVDLDYYDDVDNLDIEVYKGDKLIRRETIPETNTGELQISAMSITNLEEGVYKVVLSNSPDVIVKKIVLNQGKLVFLNRIFVTDPFNLTMYSPSEQKVSFFTPSKPDMTIFVTNTMDQTTRSVYVTNQKWVDLNFKSGWHSISSTQGNAVIKSDFSLYSFSKESYFNPFKFYITNNIDTADYIISDYVRPSSEGEWLIAKSFFNVDDLLIQDNKVNFVLHTPYLENSKSNESSVSVEYIKLGIEKNE